MFIPSSLFPSSFRNLPYSDNNGLESPINLSYQSYPPPKVVARLYLTDRGIKNVVRIGRGKDRVFRASEWPGFYTTPYLLSIVSFLHGEGEVSEGADAMIAFEYFMLRGKNTRVYRGGLENCSVE
jgi:hypothetical protein